MSGYLEERRNKAQKMLDFCNYELSDKVVAEKTELQTQMAKLLENNEYGGVIDVTDYCLSVETTDYDFYNEVDVECFKEIVKIRSCNGEVYAEDADENEYFIDDIDLATFKKMHEIVTDICEM